MNKSKFLPGDVVTVKSEYMMFPTKPFLMGGCVDGEGDTAVVIEASSDRELYRCAFFGTGHMLWMSKSDIIPTMGCHPFDIIDDEGGTGYLLKKDGVMKTVAIMKDAKWNTRTTPDPSVKEILGAYYDAVVPISNEKLLLLL